MTFLRLSSFLSFLILAQSAEGLQVTPNSPCAAVCLDDSGQDVSDPNTSNTFGKDIVCLDADYTKTEVGKKYQACVSCLQASTASDAGEDDQGWFLYNLRYTLSSCLFGFENATDAVSTPCSTEGSCGPLAPALEDGNLDPADMSQYGYCSADNNAFLGSYHSKCISCLQGDANSKYLANFVTALRAGCVQQPHTGILIGIQGSVFSTTPVNITYPGYTSGSTKDQSKSKGLTQGAIIGIAVGLGVLLIITAAILFVCFRERRNAARMTQLKSPLDARFGAPNITSPSNGAYGNPYASPQITVNEAYEPPRFFGKEPQHMGHVQSSPGYPNDWQKAHFTGSPPSYSGPLLPTHKAYIPPEQGPISPATSIATNTTASTHSSPKYIPPSTHISPRSIPPSTKASPRNIPPSAHVSLRSEIPLTDISPHSIPPSTRTSPRSVPPSTGTTLRHIPPPIQVPYAPRSPPQQLQLSEIQVYQEANARISPNPPTISPPLLETRHPARSSSRNEMLRRGINRIGGGHSNPGNADSTSQEAPVQISGPMVHHVGRFDFELAERERMGNERDGPLPGPKQLDVEQTPASAESPEQWPGSY